MKDIRSKIQYELTEEEVNQILKNFNIDQYKEDKTLGNITIDEVQELVDILDAIPITNNSFTPGYYKDILLDAKDIALNENYIVQEFFNLLKLSDNGYMVELMLKKPLKEMPLFINDKKGLRKAIANWRLRCAR